ncbi:MAG: hypothetical protein AB7N61_17750 [Acidimicrobiia bacterium]
MTLVVTIITACAVVVALSVRGLGGNGLNVVACGTTRDAIELASQVFRTQHDRYPTTLDELTTADAPLLHLGRGVVVTDNAPGLHDTVMSARDDGWIVYITFADPDQKSSNQAPVISGCEA